MGTKAEWQHALGCWEQGRDRWEMREPAVARVALEAALEAFLALDEALLAGDSALLLSRLELESGAPRQALLRVEQAEAQLVRGGFLRGVARAVLLKCEVLLRLGNAPLARQEAARAQGLARRLELPLVEALAWLELAEAERALLRRRDCGEALEQARACAQRAGACALEARVCELQGQHALSIGLLGEARARLRGASVVAASIFDREGEGWGRMREAEVIHQAGSALTAWRVARLADRHFAESRCVAGRLYAARWRQRLPLWRALWESLWRRIGGGARSLPGSR